MKRLMNVKEAKDLPEYGIWSILTVLIENKQIRKDISNNKNNVNNPKLS